MSRLIWIYSLPRYLFWSAGLKGLNNLGSRQKVFLEIKKVLTPCSFVKTSRFRNLSEDWQMRLSDTVLFLFSQKILFHILCRLSSYKQFA